MTLKQALSLAREKLASGNIEDAPLESELLLRHVLGIDRARLYLDLESELYSEKYGEYLELIERRLNGEPTAYITHSREFYRLDFYVDSRVLIPRPETELLVERAIDLIKENSYTKVADIGTGSGAIAVSIAVNLPEATVYATDISAPALEVALDNCRRHGVEGRITLMEGDMLEPVREECDLIVANLPYIRESELREVNTAGFEPVAALDGGADGLDKIRRLCGQASGKLRPGGAILLEIGQGQDEEILTCIRENMPSAVSAVYQDYAGIERVVQVVFYT